MHILLISSSKLLSDIDIKKWKKIIQNNNEVSLFTDCNTESYFQNNTELKEIFHSIKNFNNLPHNDLVEVEAIQLNKIKKIDKIIPLIESEILRAARLREIFNIEGETETELICFRDKFEMKTKAQEMQIPIAKFKKISNSIDLLNFIENVNFPVVIKPISGRGSADTCIIKNQLELEEKLAEGMISNTSRITDLLAEEYIDGEIYHADGLILNNKINLISVAKYINNCLSFVNGSYLGSTLLNKENELNEKIISFVKNLIINVFKFPTNCLFHIEIFVKNESDLILCEVACRIGGNGIKNEIQVAYGRDILIDYLSYELGNLNPPSSPVISQKNVSGRLLIPPKESTLIKTPQECPFPWVVQYKITGIIGKKYEKMKMSNSEIASFLLEGDSENDIYNKINQLNFWFNENCLWQEG